MSETKCEAGPSYWPDVVSCDEPGTLFPFPEWEWVYPIYEGREMYLCAGHAKRLSDYLAECEAAFREDEARRKTNPCAWCGKPMAEGDAVVVRQAAEGPVPTHVACSDLGGCVVCHGAFALEDRVGGAILGGVFRYAHEGDCALEANKRQDREWDEAMKKFTA